MNIMKDLSFPGRFSSFRNSLFGFPSDFEIRISDLASARIFYGFSRILNRPHWLTRPLGLALLLAMATPATAQLAIRARTVHTMAGEPIENGVVLVRESRIEAVGPATTLTVPDGYQVLDAAVVTPGLVDAHSVVGLAGILNQPHDQEQLDPTAPIQPELRAIDAYNPRDPLVDWVRGLGVTTLHTGHAPAALISGQTMIVKTHPPNLDQAVVLSTAMIAGTLGPSAVSAQKDKAPGSSGKAVAMLRAELIKASEYQRKLGHSDPEKRPARDLRMESLAKLLDGALSLLLTAHRHQDIHAALRLAEEFKLRLVLDGAADAPLVLDDIRRSGFPVILHPTMTRANEQTENLSFETAALLKGAGVLFALQSGYETYVPRTRVVLLEAAVAAGNGLAFREALASITIDAARILGIQDRVGSIEPGKDADLALYNGDPFEYTTHCIGVIVSGVLTDTAPR
jgi:imidazolonepropionase-like amidohydrolase